MKTIASVISIGIMLAACSGGNSIEAALPAAAVTNNTTATKPAANNLISFKVNGETVKTTGWTISRFKWKANGEEHLNITSNMHDDKRTINVNIAGAVPGTYSIDEKAAVKNKTYGSYYPDYLDDMLNSYSFSSGTFIIDNIDTVKRIVNGSFSGKVKNLKGQSMDITDGKIENGLLNIGVIEY